MKKLKLSTMLILCFENVINSCENTEQEPNNCNEYNICMRVCEYVHRENLKKCIIKSSSQFEKSCEKSTDKEYYECQKECRSTDAYKNCLAQLASLVQPISPSPK